MKRWIGRVGAAVVTSAVLLATGVSAAFAGEGYGAVAGESSGGNGGGTLPFTGADLAVYLIVGVCIIVSGIALHGYSARRSKI